MTTFLRIGLGAMLLVGILLVSLSRWGHVSLRLLNVGTETYEVDVFNVETRVGQVRLVSGGDEEIVFRPLDSPSSLAVMTTNAGERRLFLLGVMDDLREQTLAVSSSNHAVLSREGQASRTLTSFPVTSDDYGKAMMEILRAHPIRPERPEDDAMRNLGDRPGTSSNSRKQD